MTDAPDDHYYLEFERDLGFNEPGGSAQREAARHAEGTSWFARLVQRLAGTRTTERAWRKGAAGERAVGNVLARMPAPWVVVHDIPIGDRGANVDHLAVGPTGVFSINAKHLSGSVWVAERALLHNGRKTPYLPKASREADRVGRLLGAAAGRPVPVAPVIALVGARLTVKASPKDVLVTRLHRLPRVLTRRPTVLSAPAIEELERLARRPSTWRPSTVGEARARRGNESGTTAPVEVKRWRRRGHDRLYANDADGVNRGWMDLNTGTLHDLDPDHEELAESMLKRRAANIYRFE